MIANNLQSIRRSIPSEVTLVAVSKTKPIEAIQEAYDAGQRDFGENKAQEILEKFPALPKDIRWHFIGYLQTNKIKQIIDKVDLIHSVDRPNLFESLEKEASKIERKIDVLLQFHIAQEETKHGFNSSEVEDFLMSETFKTSSFVNIVGVMGMATFTEDTTQITKEFRELKNQFDVLKKDYFANKEDFKVISMGMSGDYPIAISCGSTMVRVGSAIFGNR